MIRTIFYALIIGLCFSCGTDNAGNKKTDVSAATPATKPAAAPVQMKPAYPSIPMDKAQHLFDNCDYIDYVFYTTNFSVSQKEKASIQTAMTYLSADVPQGLNPNCKAIGRVFYQIDGENVAEADFYFQEGCHYYVFLENGKPTYSNMMTPQGIAYFNNLFAQVNSQQ